MNNSEFGKLIKKARCEKGYTQNQLAEFLSVTVSAVSKWENGKNLPDHQTLAALGQILALSLEEMYSSSTSTPHSPHSLTVSSDISSQRSEHTIKKTVHFLTVKKIIALFIFLALISTAFIIFHNLLTKNTNDNVVQTAYRITEDSICGTVYEVACVAPTKTISSLSLESPFISTLTAIWKNDETVSPEIYIMKVSFYSDERRALAWDTPEKSIYLVR